ncbi:TPA: DUF2982 domain-containing protein [Aeromonas hydrophila]|uniref:DUF2982 domain-containing protein n=1 Tax=Aeromonas hydrophila TaxID=644 RepID=UPI000C34517A|nr:DUF2982 domain-containing protein [Aeromonas hydrophila]PKD26543.1 hypothetical protein AO056_00328 [Aeromonas hydrophila]WRK94067.1 DUF2982 domain-containing protein [Aeromonas hydrophila]HAT2712615.1 DUF2982 domain-containing protein [Aeromonas hydrophila]
MKTLHVKPMVRKNGLTLVLLGIIVTIAMIFILFLLGEQPLIPLVSGLLAGLMMIFIGSLKLIEPHFSLSLCHDCLQYHHKYGGWILKWRNIQRIDQPRIHLGWDLVPLPYIGLKIKDYDDFLTLITPRLAVRLLTEQRSVLLQALRSEQPACSSGGCACAFQGEGLLEESHFRSPSGQRYEGVIAMLANRMTRLRELLGYDLLVPDNSLDRDPVEFVRLLHQYQRESNLIQIN